MDLTIPIFDLLYDVPDFNWETFSETIFQLFVIFFYVLSINFNHIKRQQLIRPIHLEVGLLHMDSKPESLRVFHIPQIQNQW